MNAFTQAFNPSLKTPLIVAPMAGGPSTPEMVAAACNCGVLGSIGGAYLKPDPLRAEIQKTRTLTQNPFAVNLFAPIPEPKLTEQQIKNALDETRIYRQELGLKDPELAPPYHGDFEAQFAVILEEKPAAFSFIFGLLNKHHVEACKRLKIYTIGSATTVAEAKALEDSGVDAVVVQGVEAGGHRALFQADQTDEKLGVLELTRLASKQLKIPVIAAGGLMTGEDIAKVLKNGAQAAQLGTAFLLCHEAGTSLPYREALRKDKNKQTHLTRAFSGRWARGIENRWIMELEKSLAILPFPAQNAFTRDIRSEATRRSRPEFLSLWAGSCVSQIQEDSIQNIIKMVQGKLEAVEGRERAEHKSHPSAPSRQSRR